MGWTKETTICVALTTSAEEQSVHAIYLYVQPGAVTDTLGEEQHAGLTVVPFVVWASERRHRLSNLRYQTPPCFTTPHGLHVTNTHDSSPWTCPCLHISAESSGAR
ncbi:uncharacterized protein GLRG_08196 [Colletotrichum graminicola M1.001]|uniref:Uncharacterized protein n=1 Tax=Colletotrichum graminicola (strain M1.001 / M2 / FGSC 10212) TaxID=645133 RepID=E3QQB4_COLGM|nr:uncharacterized protein GLRG_08196 [Colletotrichum graminicola M1.001]EFQ33052.1 hypothetical protein GLRG_08196 [Colletotrichum graminicola M1.001]